MWINICYIWKIILIIIYYLSVDRLFNNIISRFRSVKISVQFSLFKVKKRIRLERRQFSLVNIQNTHGSCDKLNATRREGFKACLRAERPKKSTVPEGETSDKYFLQSFVSARDSLTRETSSMHRAFAVNYCASRVYLGACEEISAIIFLLRSCSTGFFSGWIF